MKSLLQSDITKTLLYLILTLGAAAALSPWAYNAGKMIAEVAESRSGKMPDQGFTAWLGAADFSWFFLISLITCAALLCVPLICWLRLSNRRTHPVRPWSLRVRGSGLPDIGQPLVRHPRRWFVWITGFLLAGSLLTLMNWLFLRAGWYTFSHPLDWLPALAASFAFAAVMAIVTEWIFRGVLLGVLLRSLRPGLAILISALIFAGLYAFIPSQKSHFANGGEVNAGVRYLVESMTQLSTDPGYLAGYISMLIGGAILGYARYRTASLSLSTGVLTGWLCIVIFSYQILAATPQLGTKLSLFLDTDRISGAIPLCFIIATGLLIHVFLEMLSQSDEPTSETD